VELIGQLVGGELAAPGGACGAAGGELADGGHLGPGDPGLEPPRGRDDPHQLVIRQPGQPFPVLADQGVHHRGQQRPGRHGVRLAVLGKPGHIQLLGRQAHEQALLSRVRRRRIPGAVRLLVVVPRVGGRVWDHAPPLVREKRSSR
jgi:hypothetical protein